MSRLRYEIEKILIDCERIHLPGGKWLDREEALERIMKTITGEGAEERTEQSFTLRDKIWDIVSEYEEEKFNAVKALEEIMVEIDKEQKILRPPLRWFVGLMEEDLKKNDFKGGWTDGRLDYYWGKAIEHLNSLRPIDSIEFTDQKTAIGHCYKVANYAMMLAHNILNKMR